jgi:hypothetical protein
VASRGRRRGQPRNGAHVAEVTACLPTSFTGPGGWPTGTRVIVRRERPHPARNCGSPTSTGGGSPPSRPTPPRRSNDGARWRLVDLEIRHRLRARAEDRIRGLKDTGLTNLPLHAFVKNELWLEIAQLAYELTNCTQVLGFNDQPAHSWEPKRLRLRLFAVAGRIITTGRRRTLRISKRWPWADLITTGHAALAIDP